MKRAHGAGCAAHAREAARARCARVFAELQMMDGGMRRKTIVGIEVIKRGRLGLHAAAAARREAAGLEQRIEQAAELQFSPLGRVRGQRERWRDRGAAVQRSNRVADLPGRGVFADAPVAHARVVPRVALRIAAHHVSPAGEPRKGEPSEGSTLLSRQKIDHPPTIYFCSFARYSSNEQKVQKVLKIKVVVCWSSF